MKMGNGFDWSRRAETTTEYTLCANCGSKRSLHFQDSSACFYGPAMFTPKNLDARNLVTPEWAKYRTMGCWTDREHDVICARCGQRHGEHMFLGLKCPVGDGTFVITEEAARATAGWTESACSGCGAPEGRPHKSACEELERRLREVIKGTAKRLAPPSYVCAPGCTPAAPCMTREVYDAIDYVPATCPSRHHLEMEREVCEWMEGRRDGIADPQAPVRVSRRVDGVRWNGRP